MTRAFSGKVETGFPPENATKQGSGAFHRFRERTKCSRAGKGLRQIAGLMLIAPIKFYRYFISPMFPPTCRFVPTCSQYAIEAITRHGPLKGSLLTVRRLLRCHPITWLGGSHGYDPVPPL